MDILVSDLIIHEQHKWNISLIEYMFVLMTGRLFSLSLLRLKKRRQVGLALYEKWGFLGL